MSKVYVFIIGIICAALYTGGVVYLGYDYGHKGEVALQAKWDAQKVTDAAAAKQAQITSDAETTAMRNNFNALASRYMRIVNAPAPSIASAIPAGIASGSLLLRDQATCKTNSSGSGAAATAASRAADAAATQALAERVSNSIAAVRVGDASDKRELDLDAQITTLQAALVAERAAYKAKYIGTTPNGGH